MHFLNNLNTPVYFFFLLPHFSAKVLTIFWMACGILWNFQPSAFPPNHKYYLNKILYFQWGWKIEIRVFNIHCWIQKVDRNCDSSINAENIWRDAFQNVHDIFETLSCWTIETLFEWNEYELFKSNYPYIPNKTLMPRYHCILWWQLSYFNCQT